NSGGSCGEGTPGLTVTGSTFNDNYARDSGGGLYNQTNTACLTNDTVSTNGVGGGGFGGGIYNNATLNLTNVTITANKAEPGQGGGLRVVLDSENVANTIIANNPGGDCNATVSNDLGNNLDSDSSCFTDPSSLHVDSNLVHLGPLA